MRIAFALAAVVPLVTADTSPTRVQASATATIRGGVRVGTPRAGSSEPAPASEHARPCDQPQDKCRLLIRDMP